MMDLYYKTFKTVDPNFKVEDGGIILKKDKGDEIDTSSCQNSDIIYSQDLIIRATHAPASFRSSASKGVVNFKRLSKGVVNFKRLRKREIESGNSFKDLIPFSKYPYRESEHGNEEVAEHVKEEKKRKQIEAIAEDLFNNEKTRRRGAAGSSIRELLTRGTPPAPRTRLPKDIEESDDDSCLIGEFMRGRSKGVGKSG